MSSVPRRDRLRLLLLAGLFASSTHALGAGSSAAVCRRHFSVPSYLRSLAAGPRPILFPVDDIRWRLLAYYKWRAFAATNPKLCDPLKIIPFKTDAHGEVGGDVLCRDLFHRLTFVRGYVEHAPNLRELCMKNVVNEGDSPDRDQLARYEKACSIIIMADIPVIDRCSQAIDYMPFPPLSRPKHKRRCYCDFNSMKGDPQCHDDPGNNPQGFLGPHRYDSLVAFHDAYLKKDPARCGSLELCRGLMGQAAEMAHSQSEKIADLACPSN